MLQARLTSSRWWQGAHCQLHGKCRVSSNAGQRATSTARSAAQDQGAAAQATAPPAHGATSLLNKQVFRFRHFDVAQGLCTATHKIGTDAMLLGAWCHPGTSRRVLDVGTGTGVLALMVAQRAQHGCHIDAIDVDAASVQQAAANASASSWAERIAVHHASLQAWLAKAEAGSSQVNGHGSDTDSNDGSTGQCCVSEPATCSHPRLHSYDLIISNPPYFLNSSKPGKAQRAAARHADVLLPFDVLANAAAALLVRRGALAVVLPVAEGELFIAEAVKAGLALTRLCRVRTRAADTAAKRLLMQFQQLGSAEGGGAERERTAGLAAVESSSQLRARCLEQPPQQRCNSPLTICLEEQELVITELQWCEELGREENKVTAAYRALTHDFHHPDYF